MSTIHSHKSLAGMPDEVLAHIFSFLDYRDLYTVSRVNHLFHQIYLNSSELQYAQALQISGMTDYDELLLDHDQPHVTGSGAMSVHDKLKELQRYESAWRILGLGKRDEKFFGSKRTTIELKHQTSHIYDLSAGVYLLGDCKGNTGTRDTHTLRVFDLSTCGDAPTPDRVFMERADTRKEDWPELTVPTDIVDVGVCLEEFDLVAIVGLERDPNNIEDKVFLHLRQLSTGLPHPLAREPDIILGKAPRVWGKMSIMLEIVGPRLVLLMTWRGLIFVQHRSEAGWDTLLLLNWWDGRVIQKEYALNQTWEGFVFLSPDLLLLPEYSRIKGLDVIRLPDVTAPSSTHAAECSSSETSSSSTSSIRDVGLGPDSDSDAKPFERVFHFAFPLLESVVSIIGVYSRAEPNPFGKAHPDWNRKWSCLRSKLQGGNSTNESNRQRRFGARGRQAVAKPNYENSLILLKCTFRELSDQHRLLNGQWGVVRHSLSLVVHRKSLLEIMDRHYEKVGTSDSVEIDEDYTSNDDILSDLDTIRRLAPSGTQERHKKWLSTRKKVPTVPWSEWGKVARWHADDRHVSNWITTSAGQRYVGIDDDCCIVVKDYNPNSVKRARYLESVIYPHKSQNAIITDDSDDDSDYQPSENLSDEEENTEELSMENQDDCLDVEIISDEEASALNLAEGNEEQIPLPSWVDSSWNNGQIVDKYSNDELVELKRLFKSEIPPPLPCVEFVQDFTADELSMMHMLYDSLLMDEERIIGLRHNDRTGSISKIDVITL